MKNLKLLIIGFLTAIFTIILLNRSFAFGFFHPFTGFDHILAAIAIGVLSVKYEQKKAWILPAVFISFMLVGGLIGLNKISIPAVEPVIALSIVALGIALAITRKLPYSTAMAGIALFALFHGHSHGIEFSSLANPAIEMIGALIATASLHLTGVLSAKAIAQTSYNEKFLKYFGIAMSVVGLFLIAGI